MADNGSGKQDSTGAAPIETAHDTSRDASPILHSVTSAAPVVEVSDGGTWVPKLPAVDHGKNIVAACEVDNDIPPFDTNRLPNAGTPLPSCDVQKLRYQVFSLRSNRFEDFRSLAQQAADAYVRYVPVVLCDLRDVTFWFRNPTEKGPNGEMVLPMSENGSQLFAPDAFFEALAQETVKRMSEIHPISVVYLLWTFTRKFGGKNIPSVYLSASPHLTRHLDELDRCGIGMVPWCYAKSNVRDDKLMDACAVDLIRRSKLDLDQHSSRPEHQLAPRNVQNTYWAYARAFQYRSVKPSYIPGLFYELHRVARKLLKHDPQNGPKTVDNICRGYTTEYGKLIAADSFRLMSLGLIAQSYKDLELTMPTELEGAMEEYTLKGLALPPFECDKFFLMDSYDIVLAAKTLSLTPALSQALRRVAMRHLARLKPKDKEELRVLGILNLN